MLAQATPRKGFAPPPEVPRYFAQKRLKPAFSYLDVWRDEHAHSFTVAKITELDVLASIKASLEQAIERGETFETWRAGLRDDLATRGWWGERVVADPTGQHGPASVDLSSPRRLRTIFETNMRSARAAGQWERIQRSKRALPYLLYVRTTSLEPRAAHLAFAGLVLPVDHPFWRTHFPPNGWRCKCAVRQISAREAARALGKPGYTDKPGEIVWESFENTRTGVVERTPVGIDPGFAWNPGLSSPGRVQKLAELLEAKLDAVTDVSNLEAQARRVMRDVVNGPGFEAMHQEAARVGTIRHAAQKAAKAAGANSDAARAAANAAAPFRTVNHPIAILPSRLDDFRRGRGAVVTASDEGIGHSYSSHPTTPDEWVMAQIALDRGQIQASRLDADRLWAFAANADGEPYCVVMVWRAGAWRVNTLFRVKPTYVLNQAAKDGRYVVEDAR